MPFDMT